MRRGWQASGAQRFAVNAGIRESHDGMEEDRTQAVAGFSPLVKPGTTRGSGRAAICGSFAGAG